MLARTRPAIPRPPPRDISGFERLVVKIMRGDPDMLKHGLHGTKLVYFTTVFVSLGVFLFGYDQGVMSGIITGPFFKDYFNQPTRSQIGTMVAILEVGAFFSSLVVGRVADEIGRCSTIRWGSFIFCIGGLIQTLATSIPWIILGRIIAGFGVGALSTIVPVYQSEISPPNNRGRLACIEFTGNIAGYSASVWVGYFASFLLSNWSWRFPLSLQVIMGSLLFFGSYIIPESPRWLIDNKKDEAGFGVVANLYGDGDIDDPRSLDEYTRIREGIHLEHAAGRRSGYKYMFSRYGKRVFVAMSAQALAQLNGINVISYYAPLVFEQAGWVGRDAILMTGFNSITYLASTIPPWGLIDSWGRRPILKYGAIAMTISLSSISYVMYLNVGITPTMVVILVMIYNAAFGFSWGPIPWLYPPEILPLSVRSMGASMSTATNWAFNWLVGEVTPVLQEKIEWRLYLIHAFFCAVSFFVVIFVYPETANVRLEDMDKVFNEEPAESLPSGSTSESSSLRLRPKRTSSSPREHSDSTPLLPQT